MRTETIYDSQRKIPFHDILEVYNYRFLIFQMIRRDILTRYKRSVLGVTWTMLNPLGTMVVLTIVFSSVFSATKNYPIYVLTGILAWNFFSKSTSAAMHNMVWGGSLLRRIYLPPTAFSVSAIGTELVNLVLSLVPLALMLIILRFQITLAILFLPISMLVLAAFSLGIALALARYAVFFPDVVEMYQIVLTAWMYISPIIFPVEMFPKRLLFLLNLNPMTSMVQLFRMPIYEGRIPTLEEFLVALAWSLGSLVIGWFLFVRKTDEYAYRV
jgi:ABC-2 type transport system permease protein